MPQSARDINVPIHRLPETPYQCLPPGDLSSMRCQDYQHKSGQDARLHGLHIHGPVWANVGMMSR